jgi:hypothetical protein
LIRSNFYIYFHLMLNCYSLVFLNIHTLFARDNWCKTMDWGSDLSGYLQGT